MYDIFHFNVHEQLDDLTTKKVSNFKLTEKYLKSRFSLIVRVNVVLNRTVVVDSDCQQQQSYSGLRSPGRSNSTYF